PPLPRPSGRPGSDIREDLDPRRALNPGLLHPGTQGRVVREAARLLGTGEVMGDEQVAGVILALHHALPGAAVLGPQRLVDLAPCGVVLDPAPDGKCRADLVSPSRSGLPAPAAILGIPCLRVKMFVLGIYIS